MIKLELQESQVERIDEIIGNAVIQHFGVENEYDDEGDWQGRRSSLVAKAEAFMEKLVAERAKQFIEEELRGRVKTLVDEALTEGFATAYGKKMTPAEHVATILKARSWTAPREFKGQGMNFVEFVAWHSAKGQIEEEAKRLIEEMRQSLSDQIAQNLGDQLAGRMLKGAR